LGTRGFIDGNAIGGANGGVESRVRLAQGIDAGLIEVCYMSDKAAQLLDADVLRKFFGDLNTVALDGNFDRKALSARRED